MPHRFSKPLDALEYLRDRHNPQAAHVLAEVFVCTQADEPEAWTEEVATILRYVQRTQGSSFHGWVEGNLFRDYDEDHHGKLSWHPEVIRHGAREFLGE